MYVPHIWTHISIPHNTSPYCTYSFLLPMEPSVKRIWNTQVQIVNCPFTLSQTQHKWQQGFPDFPDENDSGEWLSRFVLAWSQLAASYTCQVQKKLHFPKFCVHVFLNQRSHFLVTFRRKDGCLWCLLAYQSTGWPPGLVSRTTTPAPLSSSHPALLP